MIRHSGVASGLCSSILVVIVLIGPLAFGGVLPRERAALQVAAFAALALALLAHRRPTHLRLVRLPLFGLLAAAGLGVLQSLPWPSTVVAVVSPRLAALWRDAAALLGEAGPLLVPLSIAPSVSRQVALQWLAVAACLAAACLQGRERGARRLLVMALALSGVVQIAYGADRWISRRSQIWGLDVPGEPGRLRGTFVNPDHFAFFIGLGVACCAAWLLWAVRRAFEAKEPFEHRLMRLAVPAIAFSMLFVGLAFSGSRAGLVAAILALAIQGLVLAVRYQRWQMVLLAAAPLALGVIGLVLFGWQRGLARWLETSAYDVTWNARLFCWQASLELWASSPLTGTGLGTFRQAFPLVQPADLGGTWHHAHSDVLEVLVTLGLPGWLLLGAALWGLVQRLWKVYRRGRRSEDRAGALGALGVLSMAFLHSLADFGLTIPANAFALAIMLGLACGTLTLEKRDRRGQDRTVFMDRDANSEPYNSEPYNSEPNDAEAEGSSQARSAPTADPSPPRPPLSAG